MKNILKLAGITTDLRRVSGDINRTGTTFLIMLGALALGIIVLNCTPKKSQASVEAAQSQTTTENGQTILDPNFSIYGVWRYVGSADVEHDETWQQDGLDLISLYNDDGKCIVVFGNYIYDGIIYRKDGYSHQFNAHTCLDLDNGEIYTIEGQGPHTFIFGYNPATKRLIEVAETVERYFEWV